MTRVADLIGAELDYKKRRDDPTYISWSHMMARCFNHKLDKYKYYGGRGITVCDRWKDFRLFVLDMGERPKGTSLDRKDPNGNYEPSNCRWITHLEQCSNRRSNVLIEWQSQTRTLKQWAEHIGIPYKTLWMRRRSGWSVERMLTEGLRYEKSF